MYIPAVAAAAAGMCQHNAGGCAGWCAWLSCCGDMATMPQCRALRLRGTDTVRRGWIGQQLSLQHMAGSLGCLLAWYLQHWAGLRWGTESSSSNAAAFEVPGCLFLRIVDCQNSG